MLIAVATVVLGTVAGASVLVATPASVSIGETRLISAELVGSVPDSGEPTAEKASIVPEPSTAALMLVGIASLALRQRFSV